MKSFSIRPYTTRVARLLLSAGLCLGPATAALAQSRVSTSAAPFLTLGTGARGTALGHAYTALVAGADALFWNPAGAARAYDPHNRSSVFFSHTQWLVDTDYNAFAMTIPITSSGALGISLAQMDYGRMNVTTVDLPGGTGETYGASDLVVGVSYAQPLTNTFYIGGTIKYVRQNIYDMDAGAAAFDIGFVLESEYFNGMRLGASIMNFGGQMQMRGVNARKFIDIGGAIFEDDDVLPGDSPFGLEDLGLLRTAGENRESEGQDEEREMQDRDTSVQAHRSCGAADRGVPRARHRLLLLQRRQRLDGLEHRDDLRMLLLRHLAGDEDAEVPDVLVDRGDGGEPEVLGDLLEARRVPVLGEEPPQVLVDLFLAPG